MRHAVFSIVSVLTVAFFIGCGTSGPALFPVRGTVTVKGEPMEGVNVTFAPVDGRLASSGRTNSSGAFVLIYQSGKAGAVAGKHKVLLTIPAATEGSGKFSPEKELLAREAAMKGGAKGAPGAGDTAKSALIPPDYANPQKTPLEYVVEESSNDFDVPVP